MFAKKNISILLFILAGCAIIALANPIVKTEKTASMDIQGQKKETPRQFSAFLEKSEPQPTIGYYSESPENSPLSPEQGTSLLPEQMEQVEGLVLKTEINLKQENKLSLENILAEIDQMAAKLKIKFEKSQKQTCSTCGNNQSQAETSEIPTCSAILAVGAGACNCATLGCTPPTGPWCVNPCCCVCCVACCR